MTAFEAKQAGTLAEHNMATMHIDWVTFEGKKMPYRPVEPGEHYRLIVEATWEKVRQNPKVKDVLLATGDLKLKPDHHQEPNAPAAWRYYEILMDIRTRLRGDVVHSEGAGPPQHRLYTCGSAPGRLDTARERPPSSAKFPHNLPLELTRAFLHGTARASLLCFQISGWMMNLDNRAWRYPTPEGCRVPMGLSRLRSTKLRTTSKLNPRQSGHWSTYSSQIQSGLLPEVGTARG